MIPLFLHGDVTGDVTDDVTVQWLVHVTSQS